MKAIVSVSGKDKAGIIAEISALLAKKRVNIEDISQTITQDDFILIMRVDTSLCPLAFDVLASRLMRKGEKLGVAVTLRREDIFDAIHRI